MKKSKTSIVFTGDIGFDRYMANKWEDEQLLSDEVLDYFHSADHVLANVEGALIAAEDNGSHGVFFHAMDPAATTFLKKIRADIWTIANNHISDAGDAGLVSTRRIAAQMGCNTIGAGLNEQEASEPTYLLDEAGGIGILAVAYQKECIAATDTKSGIFRWNDMELIGKRIAEIKKKCRWCVIVAHGGEEFAPMPLPYTRDRYVKYLEMGADVVVGHHPHVVENYELFDDGKAIFYSLGNFIFDTNYQRAHLYTDDGALLKLTFTEEKMDFDAIGLKLIRGEERIVKAELPKIFANIPKEEYELLAPLGAKAYIAEEKRKMIFLEPEKYTNATLEEWEGYFYSEDTDGYFKGEHMDLGIVYPFSLKAERGEWKMSKLEDVKEYMLKLI